MGEDKDQKEKEKDDFKGYITFYPEKPQIETYKEAERIFRPVLDFTYNDIDEGIRRIILGLNMLSCHLLNISIMSYDELHKDEVMPRKSLETILTKFELEIRTLFNSFSDEANRDFKIQQKKQIDKYISNTISKVTQSHKDDDNVN